MKHIILLGLSLLITWSSAQAQDLAVGNEASPAPVLGGKVVRVLVELSELRLTLYSPEGKVEKTLTLVTGDGVAPTHSGTKIVNAKRGDSPQESAELGTHFIDLSWYDPDSKFRVKSDEEMHGTHVAKSLGCNASHACIRLHNPDFEWLYERLEVGDVVLVRD